MNAIDVEALSLSFNGLPILKDISFSINEGNIVGLLGANGSGKSTLVKAILGLNRYQQGKVWLLGVPRERFSAWDKIGYVPQRASVSLHATTVAEVVASGTLAKRPVGWVSRRDHDRVMEALDLVGLAGRAKELYLHLSGGQQQRVLIARGIVNHPRLIVMDEPFAGVDAANQATIATALNQLSATVLVVLHETGSLESTLDRTLILRDGRLVYDGQPPSTTHHHHEAPTTRRVPLLSGMEPTWTS
jgi:zinc transport system ATP-binding protein